MPLWDDANIAKLIQKALTVLLTQYLERHRRSINSMDTLMKADALANTVSKSSLSSNIKMAVICCFNLARFHTRFNNVGIFFIKCLPCKKVSTIRYKLPWTTFLAFWDKFRKQFEIHWYIYWK